MSYSNTGSFRRQFNFLRRQFLQDGQLPFTDSLCHEVVAQALDTIEDCWKDRIFTPLVTLWVFLGQVLSSDHSCRDAVARLIAHRVSRGLEPCSSRTGAYCRARQRLPEKFFSTGYLSTVVTSAATVSVPKTSGHFPRRPVPWWTPECTVAVKEKRADFSRLRRHRGNPHRLDAFRRKEALRTSWQRFVSSINSRTSLTQV